MDPELIVSGGKNRKCLAENKWVTGVVTLFIGVTTPFITVRGPPCIDTLYLQAL